MKNVIYSLSLLVMLMLLFLTGCADNSTQPQTGKGQFKAYLIDSAAELDSLIICVSRVDVHKSGSDTTSGWITINDTLRYFDLLTLTNGISAVLGSTQLDAGNYTQIRLILADSNYVVDTNGVMHHLFIPSGMQTGIKLTHNFTITDGNLYELYLDFNAGKSINITGNGKYMLKPTIRVIPMVISGSISGTILPLDAEANISAVSGTDTISTHPLLDGTFLLFALPADTFNVTVTPGNNLYADTTIAGVNVVAAQNTDLGTIDLKIK